MPYPAISALPAVPSRNAPSTFSALMDAFLAAFPQFRSELNALAAYLDTLALATGPGLFLDGSDAAPGIAFAADPNTGFRRTAADELAVITGGVQRLLLSSTVLSSYVGLNFTPTLAFDRSGSAAGVGRGSLGFYAPAGSVGGQGVYGGGLFFGRADASTRRKAAIAAVQTGTDLNQMGLMFLTYGGTSTATDLVSPRVLIDHNGGVRFNAQNVFAGATLDPLPSGDGHLMFHRGNILGTVSQSAGVPTGAVIERGSNANGEYVKFADGTMICTSPALPLTINVAIGAVFRSDSGNWTYPAAFAAEPNVLAFSRGSANFWANAKPLTTSNTVTAEVRGFAHASQASAFDFKAVAIGRWV